MSLPTDVQLIAVKRIIKEKTAANMKFVSCFIIFVSMSHAHGFSILLLQTPYAPTHVKLLFSLVKELVNRGHWVTTVR